MERRIEILSDRPIDAFLMHGEIRQEQIAADPRDTLTSGSG
jgi:hypothetical protein